MDEDFQYGLVARSPYVGLLWLTVLLGFTAPEWLPWHAAAALVRAARPRWHRS